MSVAELQELEEVKGLIARGQQVGVLTYAEIATDTAELGLEETDVEELLTVRVLSRIELACLMRSGRQIRQSPISMNG